MSERFGKQGPTLPVWLNQHQMLDTGQMAKATRYSTEHLRRLVRAGKFPRPVKIGRRFLWPASVLIEIASGTPQDAATSSDDFTRLAALPKSTTCRKRKRLPAAEAEAA